MPPRLVLAERSATMIAAGLHDGGSAGQQKEADISKKFQIKRSIKTVKRDA